MEALLILTCEQLNVMTSVRGEWSWHVNSIVACCHSVKLCACATQAFRSQQLVFIITFYCCWRILWNIYYFHKNLEFYENSKCFSFNYNCINSIKRTWVWNTKIVSKMNMWLFTHCINFPTLQWECAALGCNIFFKCSPPYKKFTHP